MNSKLIFLIAAIAIGIGVYGLTKPPTVSQPSSQPAQKAEKTVKVYTAKQSISKGDSVTLSSLQVEQWPVSKANQFGIDADQTLPQKKSLIARQDMESGALVYPSAILTEDSPEYIDFVTTPGKVPFPLEVDSASVVGGVIRNGSYIDVLALASTKQNLANDKTVDSFRGVSLTPILMGIKVLKVDQVTITGKNDTKSVKTTLILDLSSKEVATMTIAKRIAQLEVHKSLPGTEAKELSANASDVLEEYRAINEFRANQKIVK